VTDGPVTKEPVTHEEVPLARLFAMAYRYLVENLHERLRDAGWNDVRPAFGFVLLAARDEPTTVTDLAALMGTTKQAASKLAASMTDAGYVIPAAGAEDARQRPLSLTARGRRLLATVEEIYAALEAEWAGVIGVTAVQRIRRDLTRVITTSHEGELPPVRPTW
jgi:DNA-binding MarR family transcriptional regulator